MGSPEVLAELFGGSAPAADASKLTTADRLAQSLALRAHCKRGDAARAKHTLQQMRALGVPLEPQGYNDLLGLAARGGVGRLVLTPLPVPYAVLTPSRAVRLTHSPPPHPFSRTHFPGVLLALRPSDLVRSFGGELEPVLLGLTNKPNELDNEQIELLYVAPPSPSPPPLALALLALLTQT